jgi:hypothetical protein
MGLIKNKVEQTANDPTQKNTLRYRYENEFKKNCCYSPFFLFAVGDAFMVEGVDFVILWYGTLLFFEAVRKTSYLTSYRKKDLKCVVCRLSSVVHRLSSVVCTY